jgi:hypothetical protein
MYKRFVKKEIKAENGVIVDIFDNDTGDGIMSYQGNQILKYRIMNMKLLHYEADPKVVNALVDLIIHIGREGVFYEEEE